MDKPKPQTDQKRIGGKNAPPGGATVSRVVRSGRFRFAAAFSLSCIGLYAFIFFAPPDPYMKVIQEHTARTLGEALNLFGVPVSIVGDFVRRPQACWWESPHCIAAT